jgi:hypothetical protein
MHTRTIHSCETEEYIVRDVTVISEVKPNLGLLFFVTYKRFLNVRHFFNILSVEYPFCGVVEMID